MSKTLRIEIDRQHLVKELAWCLDMEYPVTYKGKKIIMRVSRKNRMMMARGMAGLLSAYNPEGDMSGVKAEIDKLVMLGMEYAVERTHELYKAQGMALKKKPIVSKRRGSPRNVRKTIVPVGP